MKTNYEIANRFFPDQTTAERMKEDWDLSDGKTVVYGNYVCVSVRYYDNTARKATYYAAVYAYHRKGNTWSGVVVVDDVVRRVYDYRGEGNTLEDRIDLQKIAWELFEDEGHALKWAFETADNDCRFTRAEIIDDAERNGTDAALRLLQLAGPENFAGTEQEFFDLEAELKKEGEEYFSTPEEADSIRWHFGITRPNPEDG